MGKGSSKPIQAVCCITNSTENIQGHVLFSEVNAGKTVQVDIKLYGFKNSQKRGFHIHECGDLRSPNCEGCCAHFNPYNMHHGSRTIDEYSDKTNSHRHVGDLGNITPDQNGKVKETFRDDLIRLRGEHSIIGRSIVIHEKSDDLGLGGDLESLKTGNAGKRVACGVIGYAMQSE